MLNNADHKGGSDPTCYTWVRSDLLLTTDLTLISNIAAALRCNAVHASRPLTLIGTHLK